MVWRLLIEHYIWATHQYLLQELLDIEVPVATGSSRVLFVAGTCISVSRAKFIENQYPIKKFLKIRRTTVVYDSFRVPWDYCLNLCVAFGIEFWKHIKRMYSIKYSPGNSGMCWEVVRHSHVNVFFHKTNFGTLRTSR